MAVFNLKNLPRYTSGALAVILSLHFIYEKGEDIAILAASIFFLLICITDTLVSRIPNLAILAAASAGLGYHTWTAGASGLLFSFLGLLTGLALLIIPYLMGGMGAGDVKALAALGSLLGPGAVLQVFLYSALAGGILAIFHYALAHNLKEKCLNGAKTLRAFAYTHDVKLFRPPATTERLRFPYAAAIAFGFYAFVSWGGLV
jgi:prepilin peptidase CpaA